MDKLPLLHAANDSSTDYAAAAFRIHRTDLQDVADAPAVQLVPDNPETFQQILQELSQV